MARKSKAKNTAHPVAQQATDTDDAGIDARIDAQARLNTSSPCAWDGDVLVVNILGTPSAKRDVIGKIKGHQLKVSVTAAPEGGRATVHMVKFLAKEFDVPVKSITVVFGQTSIHKQLRIHAPGKIPAVLAAYALREG